MVSIKTQLVKRVTKEFIAKYSEQPSPDFEKNEKVADADISPHSKKIRNVIAGYASRIMRKKLGT